MKIVNTIMTMITIIITHEKRTQQPIYGWWQRSSVAEMVQTRARIVMSKS